MVEQSNEHREAMDRLNETNRILLEARMLSRKQPLSLQQTADTIEQFRHYTEQRRMPMVQVSREINYAESVISQWKAGNYRGDVEAVTRAINDWLERDARRASAERPKDTVSTWVAETIRTIALQADKQVMMAVIVAPAGAGKTKVLRAMTDEMRGIYLYCFTSMTEREFLASLLAAMGKTVAGKTKAALMRQVVGELKGTKRILFLDEAQQLPKAIGCIRSIHDQAQVPIVMAGTADILRYVDDRADGRGQFSSRTIRCNLLDFVCNAEDPNGNPAGRDLFTIEEIRSFFAMRSMRLADDAMRLMWALACLPNFGTLRLIGNVADIAADVNRSADMLTRQHLIGALQMLVGGEAKYLNNLAERHQEKSRVARVA